MLFSVEILVDADSVFLFFFLFICRMKSLLRRHRSR